MGGRIQAKIRMLTAELSKVLYINCIKVFQNQAIAKEAQNIYVKLNSMAIEEDTGLMMGNLNSVEDSLREILSIVYQTVFRKKVPTKLLYFSGVSMTIGQQSQVSYESLGYRKILLLFIAISAICAYVKTNDSEFLKILDVLHQLTITTFPKDFGDKYGNAFLVKVATTLFLANQENLENVKSQVVQWLSRVQTVKT